MKLLHKKRPVVQPCSQSDEYYLELADIALHNDPHTNRAEAASVREKSRELRQQSVEIRKQTARSMAYLTRKNRPS